MKHILALSLFASTIAMATAPVQAASFAAPQPEVTDSSVMLQQAASKYHNDRQMRKSWDSHRDGSRCRSRTSSCRHYYNGYWYANPWWTLPLIGGAIILNSQSHNSGNRHEAWCEDHYRSYNPRTNTWVANGGDVRQCVSPYGA